MELADERPVRDKTHNTFTPQDWSDIATANARSIDGRPALDTDHPLPPSIPR